MLAILTTHPIQYQVPLWQALARHGRVPFEVWYLTDHGTKVSRDREFGKAFSWDLEMLSGYEHRFLKAARGASPTSFVTCRLHERLSERLRVSGTRVLWIQGWQVPAYWQAVWEAKRAGVEVWLRGESNDFSRPPLWKRRVKRMLLRQLFHRVDRFLYIGSANRSLYQRFGVSEDRLYSAPYAVDNERFSRQAEQIRNQRAEIREQWKIPENAFCVLFCGKFIEKKRPLDLAEAARSLLADGRLPNLHLLFVGSGDLDGRLRECCRVVFDAENPHFRLSISSFQLPSASFAGFLNQTEISKAYVAADCLVLPSDYGETWGLVVNEAMASQLPCIISDRCGCSLDLGTRGRNSVFSFAKTAELSDCICRVARTDLQSCLEVKIPSIMETVSTAESLYTLHGLRHIAPAIVLS